jgi:hypothetical protein
MHQPNLTNKSVFILYLHEFQAELQKQFLDESFVPAIERFEKLLQQNNGGDGYFVGDDVSCITSAHKSSRMKSMMKKVYITKYLYKINDNVTTLKSLNYLSLQNICITSV